MSYEDLPKELRKEVDQALTMIELFGKAVVDIPATFTSLVTKAYDLGYCDGVEYGEKNPPIRPNY